MSLTFDSPNFVADSTLIFPRWPGLEMFVFSFLKRYLKTILHDDYLSENRLRN